MRLKSILITFTSLLFATPCLAQSLQFTENPIELKEMKWHLIVDSKKEIDKFQYVAHRGHPEGKITQFMKRYATPISKKNNSRNYLYYKDIKSNGIHRFNHFLLRMESADLEKMTEDEKLAYWLNVRNVLIIQAITTNVKNGHNIKHLRGTPSNPGPMWTEKRIIINNENLSIEDIEKYKILNNSQNPNVIYALYQGSIGGPTMPASGFTGSNLDAQLELAAVHFINSKQAMKFKKDKVILSPILIWYAEQIFTEEELSLLPHIEQHLNPKTRSKLIEYDEQALQIGEFNYKLDSKSISHKYKGVTATGGNRQINPELVRAAQRKLD